MEEKNLRRILIGTSACAGDAIRYYLMTKLQENETECYGVLVEFRGEAEEVLNVTRSKGRIMTLLESLRRGIVTPVTLRDIVEDWILMEH